jgi:Inner membrane protein YgaP-like, transmembrane domain
MGKSDKSIRLILGALIITFGIYFQSWWGVLGLIPILTSVINWCPLYASFGISTISKQKEI